MRRRERDARTMRTTMLRARERREGGSRGEEERGHKRAALRFTHLVFTPSKALLPRSANLTRRPAGTANDPSGRRAGRPDGLGRRGAHPLARLRRLVRGRPPDCGGGVARRCAPGPAVSGHGGRLHRVDVAEVRGHQRVARAAGARDHARGRLLLLHVPGVQRLPVRLGRADGDHRRPRRGRARVAPRLAAVRRGELAADLVGRRRRRREHDDQRRLLQLAHAEADALLWPACARRAAPLPARRAPQRPRARRRRLTSARPPPSRVQTATRTR